MAWSIGLIAIIVVVAVIIFLNRFYIKASREVAIVRTGHGGQRVVLGDWKKM